MTIFTKGRTIRIGLLIAAFVGATLYGATGLVEFLGMMLTVIAFLVVGTLLKKYGMKRQTIVIVFIALLFIALFISTMLAVIETYP